MTDDEIRLKIAELKGWRVYDVNLDYRVEKYMGTSPEGVFYAVLPDWPTDIAAAWELEESVPEDQRENYIDALFEITKVDDSTMYWDGVSWATYDGLWAFIHATPRTRCLAWLKWKGVDSDQ